MSLLVWASDENYHENVWAADENYRENVYKSTEVNFEQLCY